MTDLYPVAQAVGQSQVASVSQICEVLEISRSAYYAWLEASVTKRELEDRELVTKVQEVFIHHRQRYGSRRIAAELSERGIACGRRRASRLMKMQELKAIQPKSFKPRSTESRHRLGYNPNLLLAEIANGVGQVWAGTEGQFLILSIPSVTTSNQFVSLRPSPINESQSSFNLSSSKRFPTNTSNSTSASFVP